MSEAALKGAVGQVLSAFPSPDSGSRVHAEVHHIALSTSNGGRKRCLDFALASLPESGPCTTVEVAVEAKWAGSSHCTTETIAEDFTRLALVKRKNPTSRCIFILAGTAVNVLKVLSKPPFTESDARNLGIHLSNSPKRLIFDPLKKHHRDIFQKSFRDWQTYTEVPRSIVTCAHGRYPEQSLRGTVRFQSVAWEITDVDSRNTAARW